MKNKSTRGTLEVICGSMFSGKSEELIRRLKRSEIAKRNVIAFKHSLDNRKSVHDLTSHNGARIRAFAIDDPLKINKSVTNDTEVIGIDEVQFFHSSIISIIMDLVEQGKHVIVSGLDLDFRGVPFGCMPGLLAIADNITKLKAICIKCGKDAHHTQRLVDGKPAKASDPIIVIGAEECYQARCRDCFIIDQIPLTWIAQQKEK